MLKGVTNCCCSKFTSSDRSSDRSSLGEFEQLMSSSSIYRTSTRFKGSKVIATSRDELNIQKLPRPATQYCGLKSQDRQAAAGGVPRYVLITSSKQLQPQSCTCH